ncbi:MAG: family 16 glycoside hydrolase [Anaerolineales bacterium]
MKNLSLRIVFVWCLIAFVILACTTLTSLGSINGDGNNSNGGNAGSSTQSSQSNQPASTSTLASTQSATSKYFQEDFNGGLDGWSHFVVDGKTYSVMSKDPNDMTLNVQDGFMVFDLEGKDEWVYSTYDTQTYDDVRVDVSAENRGANNNNVSLICRHTSDGQWYEFNIANNGLYNIYYAHTTEDNKIAYSPIADGGSNKIKQGKDTNEYSAICQGRTLTLYINNIKTRQIDDNDYVLQSGKIGLSVSSFNVVPVTVGIDWVKISQP